MKKIVSATAIAAALLISLICVPAYAAEAVSQMPGDTDISVYAKYVDSTDFTTISTDENGNGSITLPDGTRITVSSADKATGRIIVEEVTDKEALDWIKSRLGDKADGAKIYYVYMLDENGLSQPANSVTVTVKPKDGNFNSVYAVSDSITAKLQCKAENGTVTFTTDSSSFYALRRDVKEIPGDKSPQTGDNVNLTLWIALLLVSGGAVTVTTVVSRKKKRSVK